MQGQFFDFSPFRLDLTNACLWRGTARILLPPKDFTLLHYLVTHPGRLVPVEELLRAVWPGVTVSRGVVKVRIRQIRRALGDDPEAPRFIATVHSRGYCFIAPVTLTAPPRGTWSGEGGVGAAAPVAHCLVGRDRELAYLHRQWAKALSGERHLVLVTGEPGIGKTALVDAFLAHVGDKEGVWTARGQCIEQYGSGEAYLPVLDALGRLGRQPDGEHLTTVLRQHAPTWLAHLPALLQPTDLEALQQRILGTTQERMLRELAEAVEVLTTARPLVLVLEDVHWADASTLEWLAGLARRRDAARLLVLATYRPLEVLGTDHPLNGLVAELQAHRLCVEVALPLLSAEAVATYVQQRFPGCGFPLRFVQGLYHCTEGNPLFVVSVLEDLVAQGMVALGEAGWVMQGNLERLALNIPTSIRQLVAHQRTRLAPEDQQVLEAASVAGVEFAVAAVAAAVATDVVVVGDRCARLAERGQFLRPAGLAAWPDGTVTAQYGFLHALYQQCWYERVSVERQQQWHRRIGVRQEAAYGSLAPEIAAALAVHFEQGRDTRRAIRYLQHAGEQALRRHAYGEGASYFTRALALLTTLPDTPARAQQELDLQVTLGPVLMVTRGQADPEVQQTYARALALCQQLGDTLQRFATRWGLQRFYRGQGACTTARELGEQLVQFAEREADPRDCLEAHDALGMTLFFLGDYAAARTHLAQGSVCTNPATQQNLVRRHGEAPGVRGLAFVAHTLWCLGFPAQAVQRGQEALSQAQALAHPYSLAFAQYYAARLHHRRRAAAAVQAQAEALLTLATAEGFAFFVAMGTCWRGWVLAMQNQDAAGLAQLRQGMAAVADEGHTQARPLCLILLAEAVGHVGQVEDGLRLLAEARTVLEATGQGDLLVDTYRLQGALLLQQAVPDGVQAEACFQQALTIARRQQAKSWELRVALSLARLWQLRGKRQEAYDLLAPVYGWFTEGFDTADLQEAKALLHDLS
jgi:DNA-binding winged helix-turn-helix (wHTH) protein/predicted ATPase